MPLDFTNFVSNLQKTKGDFSSDSGSDRQYPYRYVFIRPTAAAKLTVRILVNKKINAASFTYHVHKLTTGKPINCGLNHPLIQQCNFCDALQNKKNLTGVDSQEKAQVRSIMMAQYIKSSGYDWSEKYPEPKYGDIILVGGPATLHRQVTDLLLTQSQHLSQLLTDAEGASIVIGRDDKGKQITTSLSFDRIKSANSNQEFDVFLDTLPSLSDIALFGGVSAEDIAKLNELATAVDRSMNVVPVTSSTQPTLAEAIAAAETVFTPQPLAPTPVVISPANTGQITVGSPITVGVPNGIASADNGQFNNPTDNVPIPVFNPVTHTQFGPSMDRVPQPDPEPVKVKGVDDMIKNPVSNQGEPTIKVGMTVAEKHPGIAPNIANWIDLNCPKKYAEGAPVCNGCMAGIVCPYKN
jgi:hypothetical protein